MTLEFFETKTGKIVKRYHYKGKTASDEAAVFLSFLDYWERYYGQQTEYDWRSVS